MLQWLQWTSEEKTARGGGVPRCPHEVIWALSSCRWFWDLCSPGFPGTLLQHLCLWQQPPWAVVYLMGATQPKQLGTEHISLLAFSFSLLFEYVHLERAQIWRRSGFWGSLRSRGRRFCICWLLGSWTKAGIWMWFYSCPILLMFHPLLFSFSGLKDLRNIDMIQSYCPFSQLWWPHGLVRMTGSAQN